MVDFCLRIVFQDNFVNYIWAAFELTTGIIHYRVASLLLWTKVFKEDFLSNNLLSPGFSLFLNRSLLL